MNNNNDQIIKVKCPICNINVLWDKNSKFRPFCSKKCQLTDFNTWIEEK